MYLELKTPRFLGKEICSISLLCMSYAETSVPKEGLDIVSFQTGTKCMVAACLTVPKGESGYI